MTASNPAEDAEPTISDRMPMRVADLSPHRPHRFHLRPDAPARARLAQALGLIALRKLDFRGTLMAQGQRDWRLEAMLGASVEQPCVITAEPVRTRIDLPVTRLFQPPAPELDEPAPPPEMMQMPEDDTIEPLGAVIDPGAVMAEALALALPDYPRAAGASLSESGLAVAPPGSAPDAPADPADPAAPADPGRENPFAALAALKRRDGGPEGGGKKG